MDESAQLPGKLVWTFEQSCLGMKLKHRPSISSASASMEVKGTSLLGSDPTHEDEHHGSMIAQDLSRSGLDTVLKQHLYVSAMRRHVERQVDRITRLAHLPALRISECICILYHAMLVHTPLACYAYMPCHAFV